jgi:hypothetical protein
MKTAAMVFKMSTAAMDQRFSVWSILHLVSRPVPSNVWL